MSLISVIKISNLMLASVAEQAGLSLTWSETPEDMFSYDKAQLFSKLLLREENTLNLFFSRVLYLSCDTTKPTK